MPDQDAAENKALAAAHAISDQVGRLWMSAHAEGMRNGMESAALLLNLAATHSRTLTYPEGVGEWVIELLEGLRDQIRLAALQVPDPEVPSV